MVQTSNDGAVKYVYGGAFGEDVVDPVEDMCLNGVVFPDLTWKPAAYEVKNGQSPIKIFYYKHPYFGVGEYKIKNNYQIKNLSHLRFIWELQCDGKIVDSGEMKPYYTLPGQSETLDYQLNAENITGEAFVNIKVTEKEDTFYARAGEVVYHYQLPLEESVLKKTDVHFTGEKLNMVETEEQICIQGDLTEICFNKSTGVFTKVLLQGEETFTGGQDNFYRAATGIDEGTRAEGNNYAFDWRKEGLNELTLKIQSIETAVTDTQIFIFTETSYNDGKLLVSSQYRIGSKGIEITKNVINNCLSETIPRIGLTFELPEDKNQISWYGRGPWENYQDRKDASLIGLYTSTVAEQYTPYIKPVECGGKEDVRYLQVKDNKDHGICVTGAVPFHFDIHDYPIEACDRANYGDELLKDNRIYLNVDAVHAGLGGDNGWTKNIHPEYQITRGYYHYKMVISLL